jgi:hypothetical protein
MAAQQAYVGMLTKQLIKTGNALSLSPRLALHLKHVMTREAGEQQLVGGTPSQKEYAWLPGSRLTICTWQVLHKEQDSII